MAYAYEILKILFTAMFAAFLSGYAVSRWKGRSDLVGRLLDEVCNEINFSCEAGSDYWLEKPRSTRLPLLEAKLNASITRLRGLSSALEPHLSKSSGAELTKELQLFFRAATGGDFGVVARLSSVEAAKSIYVRGAALHVVIRKASLEDAKGLFRRR